MTTSQKKASELRPIWLKDMRAYVARAPKVRTLAGSDGGNGGGGGGGGGDTVAWANVDKTGSSLSDIVNRPHSALQHLTDADDHSQYVHVANARNISARHTFNPTSPNSPFIIGANATNHLVDGLNAEFVGSHPQSDFMRKDANSNLDLNEFVIGSDDGDTLHMLGRLAIGYMGGTDYGGIAHRDQATATDYALLQQNTGITYLNTVANGTIHFRANNVTRFSLDDTADVLEFASDMGIGSDNYASQVTGWKITYPSAGDFRYIYTDELHAKAFIADIEQALAGGQIISKSVTILSRNFTAPAAGGATTLYVKDLPSAENMQVFQSGDTIRLREFNRSGGSLSITNCWGVVTSPTDLADKEQSWTFTRSSAPNAGGMTAGAVIGKDAIVLDYGTTGNGFYEVNAIDGMYAVNSPYMQIVTWSGHPATGGVVQVRTGNLTGVGFTDEFGMYARGDSGAQYLKASGAGILLRNADVAVWDGSIQTVDIGSDGDVKLGTDIASASTQTFTFDSATGALRIGPLDTNVPNLFWDGSELNLRINTTKKITLDSSGASYFSGVMTIGSSGEIRQGTGTLGTSFDGFRLRNVSGVGRFSLLSNDDEDVILDNLGINLQGDGVSGGAMSRQINWWEDLTDRTGNPILSIQSRANGVFFSRDTTIIAQGTTAYPNSFVYIQAKDEPGTGGAEIKLDSDGNIEFDGTLIAPTIVDFTNAQHDHQDANDGGQLTTAALSDYIQGTWTPVITGATTNPTITYTTQAGKYTRIGNVVCWSFRIQLASYTAASGSGGLRVSLPFTCNGDGSTYGVRIANFTTTGTPVTVIFSVSNGNAYGNVRSCVSAGAGTVEPVTNLAATTIIESSGIMFT